MLLITLHSVASSVFARSCSEGVLKDAPCVAIVPPSGTVSHKETLGPTMSSESHLTAQLSLQTGNPPRCDPYGNVSAEAPSLRDKRRPHY